MSQMPRPKFMTDQAVLRADGVTRVAELAGLYVDKKRISKNRNACLVDLIASSRIAGRVMLTLPAEFCERLTLGMKFPVMADVDALFPGEGDSGV